MLEQVLPPDHVQMPLDLRVFTGEAIDFILAQAAAEAGIEFAGELVIEFGEKLGVKKEVSSCGKFVGHGIEEDFWTVVFVFLGRALLGFHGEDAQFEDVDTVAEEDSFAA